MNKRSYHQNISTAPQASHDKNDMEYKQPKTPDIEYPCSWVYTVIGEDTKVLQEIIRTACAPKKVTITPSHSSTKGKYHSLHAKLTVDTEEMRLSIYELLSKQPAVKMVL